MDYAEHTNFYFKGCKYGYIIISGTDYTDFTFFSNMITIKQQRNPCNPCLNISPLSLSFSSSSN